MKTGPRQGATLRAAALAVAIGVAAALPGAFGPAPAALAAAAAAPPPAAGQEARLRDLAPKYRDWLDEVALLISAKEREAFLALQRDYQRDAFMKRFWAVRDPFPQTPRNELQEAWEQRAKLARERYGNVVEDRARMLLVFGEPAHNFRSLCSEVVLPLEVWSYNAGGHIRHGFSLVFVQDLGAAHGRYRLWAPSQGLWSLSAPEMRARKPGEIGLNDLAEHCPQGSEIGGYLSEALDWTLAEARGHVLPAPGDEWLSSFSSMSTDLPAGAAELPAGLDVTFPGRYGSRTVVQGVVRVPREAAAPEQLEGHAFYSFVVDGEVLRGDELFEHFHYRFSLPAEQAPADAIPLVFERYLRPGPYSLVLKVEDLGGKRYFRQQSELEIPAVPAGGAGGAGGAAAGGAEGAVAPAGVGASGTGGAVTSPAAGGAAGISGAAGAAGTAGTAVARQGSGTGAPVPLTAALGEANASLRSAEQTIRIVPPQPGLITGALRIDTLTTGEGIARVSFLLDGREILAKSHPPFSVELNLGRQPRIHLVKATALGAGGQTLAEDQVVLNAGPHRFALRLTEPQAGRVYRNSLRAAAQVEVPEGDTLERVEFYLNDARVATLFQPPFVQPILIADSRSLTYVRAVAYLADGNSTEDLVLVNSPNPSDRIDVQLVELYTTVADHKGRPVEGLTRDDFKVYEDSAEQTVRRFELVRDLPIYAGVLLDTSGSMATQLDEAVQGALRFFQTVIKPKDRAAVITFASQTNLAVRFTNNPEVLAGGLAGLQASGNTVLYDSVIYALYYFGGVRGKRAIILLTDGRDEGSKYRFTDALEYAKRSGVAFYTVGLGISSNEQDVRMKLEQLAAQTGGRHFFIERSSQLAPIYQTIERELRSQYLLAYQSGKQGNDGKFRTVEVKIARPGLEARTLPGYFP
ncbi:MAG TPA: VWA domain-containing protein [Thermoanaerobaculia bacterium]|nr:VWA domain-containing protein [Thermoanaerobaculia bacterium]